MVLSLVSRVMSNFGERLKFEYLMQSTVEVLGSVEKRFHQPAGPEKAY